MDQRLRKTERLTSPADFTRCYRHGKRLRTAWFIMHAYGRGERGVRLGLAVGKAVGPAVVRNRVKRRLREIFRRHKALVPEGYDLFVRATPASAQARYAEIEQTWREAVVALQRGEPSSAAEHTTP